MLTSCRSIGSSQTATPYVTGDPSPMYPPPRCYAPSMTPIYGKSPSCKTPNSQPSSNPPTPQPGPSRTPGSGRGDDDKFSRPYDPTPGYSPFPDAANFYSPGQTPSYSYYGAGLTPGYSGPSPDPHPYRSSSQHSPVYSGPPPGLISNASTPGHPAGAGGDDFLEPGYVPSYSPAYEPSNPGTPTYSPGRQFSPGNATPRAGNSTPGRTNSNSPSAMMASSSHSPSSIQRPEISGNTTPHPGVSERSPASDQGNPKYLW